MKILAVIFINLSFTCQVWAEGIVDLVVSRTIVERKLEKLGYSKWQKVQQLMMEQAGHSMRSDLKAASHKSKLLNFILELKGLREIQSELVRSEAQGDVEVAQKLALSYETKNALIDEKITKAKKEQAQLQELAEKHKKLYIQLEEAEQELRKKIRRNREQIDPLISELASLKKKIAKLDQQQQSAENTP